MGVCEGMYAQYIIPGNLQEMWNWLEQEKDYSPSYICIQDRLKL
jgi:hypothetical protein